MLGHVCDSFRHECLQVCDGHLVLLEFGSIMELDAIQHRVQEFLEILVLIRVHMELGHLSADLTHVALVALLDKGAPLGVSASFG